MCRLTSLTQRSVERCTIGFIGFSLRLNAIKDVLIPTLEYFKTKYNSEFCLAIDGVASEQEAVALVKKTFGTKQFAGA